MFKTLINFGLAIIIAGSIGWFLFHEYSRRDYKYLDNPQKTFINKPEKGIDWAPLVPGITSILVFLFKEYRGRKKRNMPLPVSLSDHILFDTIEELINNEIPYMNFGTPGRTEVFKAILSEQLETFRDSLKDFIIENPKFESNTEYRKKLKQKIYKIVETCEQEWQARQIPQIVIDKYNHFFRDRINLLLADITTSSLRYIGKPEDALEAFLNEVRTVFKLHLQTDALHALNNLNGELDGLTYNGLKL